MIIGLLVTDDHCHGLQRQLLEGDDARDHDVLEEKTSR